MPYFYKLFLYIFGRLEIRISPRGKGLGTPPSFISSKKKHILLVHFWGLEDSDCPYVVGLFAIWMALFSKGTWPRRLPCLPHSLLGGSSAWPCSGSFWRDSASPDCSLQIAPPPLDSRMTCFHAQSVNAPQNVFFPLPKQNVFL